MTIVFLVGWFKFVLCCFYFLKTNPIKRTKTDSKYPSYKHCVYIKAKHVFFLCAKAFATLFMNIV